MSALVPKVTRELTRMRRTLRETFGLDKLRDGQAEVMRSVAREQQHARDHAERGREVALLPTTFFAPVMQYGQSAMCRWHLLHDYFAEEMDGERCGNCDNCINPLEEQIALPDRQRTAAYF